ncbi:/hemophilus virulence surface antigen family [Pseudomonas savastanoi pv. nerii]|nr:/hemophilus virulence surface antigen family [Pseudomonas savastanoi pv. nerii]RMR71453.1 /hemophilus virulence surface antigen family [Pseudomonas savastanoi pv. fraxini]RMT83201.1 /hemophilus virulence surface antigen family [Pseudomonas savastanoi pv. nerii]
MHRNLKMPIHQDGTFSCSLPHTLILQGQLPCKPVSGENQHMVGINRAGSSGAYLGGYTESERASARDSSSARPSNSPQVPPTSTAPAGREMLLLRSTELSRRTRERLEQSFSTAEEDKQQATSIVQRGRTRVRSGAGLHRLEILTHQSVERGCSSSKALSSSDDDVSSAESSEADIDAVFNYRIAALNNANASQSCMGLAIQWLRLRDEAEASYRMEALDLDHASDIQNQYENAAGSVSGSREQREAGRISARKTLLRSQDLQPVGEPSVFHADRQSTALQKIARDGSAHLISLCFENNGKRVRHAITASSSEGSVNVFDPNYGEFSTTLPELPSMFQNLMTRYGSRLNGHLQLESMVIQRVE